MSSPRVAPGTLSDLGPINWLLCRIISRFAGAPEVHLFTTLGKQRRLFRGWLRFAGRMMPGGLLSRHEAELVILRVAQLRSCQYELDHHARLGRRAQVTPDILARIGEGPAASQWSDRHRALLFAVDALVATRDIDDATWGALRPHYSDPELIELCLLVGHYDMLAMTIAALRIERDFAAP